MNLKSFVFLIILTPTSIFAATDRSFKIPSEWRSQSPVTNLQEAKIRTEFVKGTDYILKNNLDAINKLPAPRTNPWHLETIALNLGISSENNLGMLLLKGTSAIGLQWSQKNYLFEQFKENTPQISNSADLKSQIEFILPLIYASGRINNNPNLKNDLENLAKNFFMVLDSRLLDTTKSWNLEKLCLEISISSEGQIDYFSNSGAGLRIRLDWKPLQQQSEKHSLNSKQAQVQINLSKLINALIYELDTWDRMIHPADLQLSSFKVGLGITSTSEVGITKNSTKAILHAIFSPTSSNITKQYDSNSSRPSSEIKLFPFDSDINWIGVLNFPSQKKERPFLDNSLQPLTIPAKTLHSGLTRAYNIGSFFANRSEIILRGSDWTISALKTSFEISIAGGIELATVGGITTFESTFKPKKQQAQR